MAENIFMGDLPEVQSISDTDSIPVVANGVASRVTVENLLSGVDVVPTWGSITNKPFNSIDTNYLDTVADPVSGDISLTLASDIISEITANTGNIEDLQQDTADLEDTIGDVISYLTPLSTSVGLAFTGLDNPPYMVGLHSNRNIEVWQSELYDILFSWSRNSTSVSGAISEWAANTSYTTGRLVWYNNYVYFCCENHTSSSSFSSNYWEQLVNRYCPKWTANKNYYVNDLCYYNNGVYLCKKGHTSTTFEDDYSTCWTTNSNYYAVPHNPGYNTIGGFLGSMMHKQGWTMNVNGRGKNITFVRDGSPYTAEDLYSWISTFTSTNSVWSYSWDSSANPPFWRSTFIPTNFPGTYYTISCLNRYLFDGTWTSGRLYSVGTVVVRNNRLYRCITECNDTTFDSNNWTLIGEPNTTDTVLYTNSGTTSEATISSFTLPAYKELQFVFRDTATSTYTYTVSYKYDALTVGAKAGFDNGVVSCWYDITSVSQLDLSSENGIYLWKIIGTN